MVQKVRSANHFVYSANAKITIKSLVKVTFMQVVKCHNIYDAVHTCMELREIYLSEQRIRKILIMKLIKINTN